MELDLEHPKNLTSKAWIIYAENPCLVSSKVCVAVIV